MERRRRRVSCDEEEKDEQRKFASSVSAPAGTRPCQPRGGRTEADIVLVLIILHAHPRPRIRLVLLRTFSFRNRWGGLVMPGRYTR